MPRVLTKGDDFQIGAYMFPDRKRPCLCVQNEIRICGTFQNVEAADLFMNELANMVGAAKEV